MSAVQEIVTVDAFGRRERFAADRLPLTLGGRSDAAVVRPGIAGAVQIGRLGCRYFVQADRGTRNVRVNGALLVGAHELSAGDVVALDRARLSCRVAEGT